MLESVIDHVAGGGRSPASGASRTRLGARRYHPVVSTVAKRNNVRVSGDPAGQPMLFAHGFGCDSEHVAVRGAGLRGSLPGRRSSITSAPAGRTSRRMTTPATARSTGYADDVLEICDELDLEDVIFVGHSVSAMIGVLAAVTAARALRQARPDRPVAALHRRRGLRRRLQPRGHRRAAGLAGQQLPRLVERDGAGDHGRTRIARSWARS